MDDATKDDAPDGSPSPDSSAPLDQLESLRLETSRFAKAATELDKAVVALVRQVQRLESAPRPVLDGVGQIRELAGRIGGTPDLGAVLAGLESAARTAQDRAQARFGTALAAALRDRMPQEDRDLRPMDTGYAWGAFRILPDAATGRVHVEYARQGVLRNLASDPETVATAVTKFRADLEKPPFEASAFLGHLDRAYTHALAATGKTAGELIDILAFWSHLAWEMQPESFRREPTARRFRDYPLVRFAHDLRRLRAARQFEVAGRRLELEVAVHDRAYGKALWVPDDASGGSYYQAIGLR